MLTFLCSDGAQAVPEIQTWRTSNGAKVLFVAAPSLPMLDVRVAFAAGSAYDGAQPGVATLTASLLTQGAGPWDADTLAERIDNVGATLTSGADRDMAWVSVRTLTRPPALDVAIDTLAQVLAAPRFAPEDVARVRENHLVALRQAEQDPATVGNKALYRAVFGDHPYASDPDGTAASVAALQPEDARAFHRRYYVAANATLAVVGALDRPAAAALAERLLAGLPRGTVPPPVPPVPALASGTTVTIAFPSSQTHLYAGLPGMRRNDPDYYPLYVGNHILGGSGLVSLLMEEVREQRGLSYSVYSYFQPLAQPGPFVLGLQTKNDQAAAAQAVLLRTLERFIEHGPTVAELEAARQNLTGGFPLRIASNAKIVAYLTAIGFYDLPLDHLARFTARIAAVTAEQIRDAFRRRVDPRHLVVVRVGQLLDSSGGAH